jgi:hypothetical protein
MDGLSRWDLVLWIIAAYVALVTIVRMMLLYRNSTVRKLHDQLPGQPHRKNAAATGSKQREAA